VVIHERTHGHSLPQDPDGPHVLFHLGRAVDDDAVQRGCERIDGRALAQQPQVGERLPRASLSYKRR
jgi:hypothetical protein